MSIFSCKTCVEKDKRIADLKDQVTHLRQLVSPPVTPAQVEVVQREVDSILSGEPVLIEQMPNSADAEMANILTGMYSSDQVEFE